ncbi:hypothetical protein WQ57_24155 [Mesobacillus campisalis]|uniref:O-antigen ligase-related domain-containing protein n=1 Tax=Mesobacillus campisalis TaxID=1408103 RepID=A0A0M2SHF8_9BACI|nr:O-antigen ligase family protein [Mesobacillus campisalis]KKK33046.1 hypothetical protein WQ57_24155 [Mesobacillus campisalis]
MFWFLILFPLLIYPWGYDPYYTLPKVGYLQVFVLMSWLYIIIKRKYKNLALTKSEFKIEAIIICFISLICLSTLFSVDPQTALYGTKNRYEGLLTLFSYCSVLLFSYRFIGTERLHKAMVGLGLISVVVSGYGILQFFSIDLLPRNSGKMVYDRSYSFFDNPNFFGSYLVLLIMVTVTLYLTSKKHMHTTGYLVIIWINFLALIYSGTRSGWVGMLCGILLFSLLGILKRNHLWKKWGILLITLAITILVVNVNEKGRLTDRASTVFSDSYNILTNQSTGREGSNRFFIWEKSMPLLKENFWLGSGPDTFALVFPEDEEKKQMFGDVIVDKAHNEYLQMGVTIGFPGLLTYLFLIVFVLRKSLQAIRDADEKDKLVIIGLLSTIAGYLVQAFFNISVAPVAPIFWAILGITLAKSEQQINKPKGDTINIDPLASENRNISA